mmetsp:Transcript_113929/g.207255  ORF Transcript_113929/g.207255 Transcript_113929/m.207255 type:complete len:388 (+) Transcript_113929:65-1228(+)
MSDIHYILHDPPQQPSEASQKRQAKLYVAGFFACTIGTWCAIITLNRLTKMPAKGSPFMGSGVNLAGGVAGAVHAQSVGFGNATIPKAAVAKPWHVNKDRDATEPVKDWTDYDLAIAEDADKLVLRPNNFTQLNPERPLFLYEGRRVNERSCNSQPFLCIGKIFYKKRSTGESYVCSGSLIQDRVLLTASHCLYNWDSGEWATDMVFIPCYPYRRTQYHWSLMHVVDRRWGNSDQYVEDGYNAQMNRDYGMVLLQESTSSLGWLGTSYNYKNLVGVSATAYGYPASNYYESPSNNGAYMYEVSGRISRYFWACPWRGQCRASIEMLNDDFTGGSSGGPWISNAGPSAGHVIGLNSNSPRQEGGDQWSPWFNQEFQDSYDYMNSKRDR